MKVVKLATSAKLRAHLAGKRFSLDSGRKGPRWRVSMSTSAWRLLLTSTAILLMVVAAVQLPQYSHYIEKTLSKFLIWVQNDAGAWGPIILALAYVPCSVLAIPASILTLGGGYLFGLGVGFVTDSLGSTLGATAAFSVGRTIGRTYVTTKLKDYPQFQAIAVAVRKSGFKIVLLLRLVPLLPFNLLNYLLSVTPISNATYILATWFGVMLEWRVVIQFRFWPGLACVQPMTLAFVYVGTTIKDIQDISHGGAHISKARGIMLAVGFLATIVVAILVTRIARDALRTAIEESGGENILLVDDKSDVLQPLIVRIDPTNVIDASQPLVYRNLDPDL